MSDRQGQMIDLPIQSNFREGLTLTKYIISCYGARKGVVDTAIQTVDARYLTRRLVEVDEHINVRRIDCGTIRGIYVNPAEGMMTERILTQTLMVCVLAKYLYWFVMHRHSKSIYWDETFQTTHNLSSTINIDSNSLHLQEYNLDLPIMLWSKYH